MVKQYGRHAGIEKHVTPHVWRTRAPPIWWADGATSLMCNGCWATAHCAPLRFTLATIAEIKVTHSQATPQLNRYET